MGAVPPTASPSTGKYEPAGHLEPAGTYPFTHLPKVPHRTGTKPMTATPAVCDLSNLVTYVRVHQIWPVNAATTLGL